MENNVFSRFALEAKSKSDERARAYVEDVEDLPTCISPPPNWRQVIQAIRTMRANHDAPVDQMGTHQLADKTADKKTQQFQILVAAVISSQTRDSVTAAAMIRLHGLPGGLNICSLCKQELTIDQLAETLKPVGFYRVFVQISSSSMQVYLVKCCSFVMEIGFSQCRQKAKNLKAIAEKLSAPPFNGCVPCTMDELLALPGVGPKIALLVLWVAFEKGEEGFIVDTNVRRVCCRLGWAPEGSDPSQVRVALETWLPKSLWPDISFLFVGFGQQVCKPTAPQCGKCHVKELCPSALQDTERGTSKKKSKTK